MSSYKIIDSTISVLYCARCANEDLELIAPGRLYCADCGMDTTFDMSKVRVGRLKGTKYKMRAKRRYTFREIVDEGRQDAFSEVYVPSPEPGRKRIGWRHEEENEPQMTTTDVPHQEAKVKIGIVGASERPGWRNEAFDEIITSEALEENKNGNASSNGTCPI